MSNDATGIYQVHILGKKIRLYGFEGYPPFLNLYGKSPMFYRRKHLHS